MNINVERFLALTAMLAAPLVAAPACIINDSGDDDTNGSASNSNTNGTTVGTGSESGTTSPSTSAGTESPETTGTETIGDTTAADSTAGDSTAGDTTTGGEALGNCCVADDHGGGCEVTEVQDCVCGEDPVCCDEVWDAICVSEVNQFGCGTCDLPAQVWDCSCVTDCDGTPVDTTWQVCGADETEAGTNGQMACEADLMDMGCRSFVCDECFCATAEIPDLEC